MYKKVKVGLVQHPPVYNNLAESLQKLDSLLEEVAVNGASLAVFGETWLCGYPSWLDHCPNVALWNDAGVKLAYREMRENALAIGSKEFLHLQEIIKKHKLYVVLGINEKVESGTGSGTLYNSFLIFGPDGSLQNHHRKLMPTYTEKMLYGHGDGAGLKSVDSDFGKITASICWEHWMPLTRQALHMAGEHIHVALWPMVHERHEIASRHYAFEGRCYVLAVGQLMRAADFPKSISLPQHFQDAPETLSLRGGSCVIGPDGKYIVAPIFDQEAIIYADLDANSLYEERMTLDVTGHYNRDDVFEFKVNERRK
jgi:nitrilase